MIPMLFSEDRKKSEEIRKSREGFRLDGFRLKCFPVFSNFTP